MGQAKLRGTREERAEQAAIRAAQDKAAFERMRAANERQKEATIRSWPPEVQLRYRDRERVRKLRAATMLALSSAWDRL